VESTPVVLYHKGNQEEFSPTDSLVTATSLEDLEFPPDNSPITSGSKPKLSFLDPRSPHTESAHIPIQVGISFLKKSVISYASNKFMKLLKCCWAISSVNVELKTNFSEISSISIMRVNVDMLIWLIAREDFSVFIHHEGFESYIMKLLLESESSIM
jgi:hypothetical protein